MKKTSDGNSPPPGIPENRKQPYPIHAVVHERWRKCLLDGAVAIDATTGNGHDTLVLAEAVGPSGRVYALDIQPCALAAAWSRVAARGLSSRVTFLLEPHERLLAVLPSACRGKVRAVVFNLGYLPGGDKELTTKTTTTLAAVQVSQGFLEAGGLLSIVSYSGHPEGWKETLALREWASALAPSEWLVEIWQPFDRSNAPVAFMIQKK